MQDIIAEVDADGTGKMDMAEFLNMMAGSLRDTDETAEVEAAFEAFDKDADGLVRVTACGLREMWGAWGTCKWWDARFLASCVECCGILWHWPRLPTVSSTVCSGSTRLFSLHARTGRPVRNPRAHPPLRLRHVGVCALQISVADLRAAAKELGHDLSSTDLQEMVQEADQDGDGQISLASFKKLMSSN